MKEYGLSNANLTQAGKRKSLFFSRISQFKNFTGCLLPLTFPVWMAVQNEFRIFLYEIQAK